MTTDNSNQSGTLMPKPSISNAPVTSFETNLVHAFFVGRNHPIDYSRDFCKTLKEEYDKEEEIAVEIDLISGSNGLLDKPGNLSFGVLLDYIIDQRKLYKKDLEEIVMGASIVCRRGVLNKLLNAPYKDSSAFRFGVKKYRGIFFIKELSTVSSERQNTKFPGNPQACLPKFKKTIVDAYGDENYKPPKELSTWEQMQGIYVCDLASIADNKHFKVYYGTEIDAFDKGDKIVEIKLHKGVLGPTVDSEFVCEKLRKWFFQTQLVGGDTVVVGLRTNAVVTSIKKFKIDTFPTMVNRRDSWDYLRSYSAPLSVLSTVCEFYGKNVKANETLVVELQPYATNISYHVFDDNVHDILPKEFKDAFEDPVTFVDESAPEFVETKKGHDLWTENCFLDDVIEKTLGIQK